MEKSVFTELIAFLNDSLGHREPDSNRKTLVEAVKARSQFHQLNEGQYITLLKSSAPEREIFYNLITINETYFFREERQFQAIEKVIFPELKRQGVVHLNMWSVTCSTGEEPISLGILAQELWASDKRGFTVYATDINTEVLKILRAGIYGSNSFRVDGRAYGQLMKKYSYEPEEGHGQRRIDNKVLSRIQTSPGNLATDAYQQIPASIQIAFFRNTLIYFSESQRPKVLEKIASKIVEGGYLFVSASEVPWVVSPYFETEKLENVYLLKRVSPDHRLRTSVNMGEADRDIKTNPISQKAIVHENVSSPHIPSKPISLELTPFFQHLMHFVKEGSKFLEREKKLEVRYLEALKLCKMLLEALEVGQLSHVREHLTQFKSMVAENALIEYFEGSISRLDADSKGAVKRYEACLRLDQSFWPARYYLAMLTKEYQQDQAKKEFGICIEQIGEEIKGHNLNKALLFDLNEFDMKYILELCQKWNRKLAGQ
jgi:chemotaxis protein methyltransferase CheR